MVVLLFYVLLLFFFNAVCSAVRGLPQDVFIRRLVGTADPSPLSAPQQAAAVRHGNRNLFPEIRAVAMQTGSSTQHPSHALPA